MSSTKLYNNMADRFGSISKSHDVALKQIQLKIIPPTLQSLKILDMGVGDGSFLKKLFNLYPNSEFYGFDISKQRLKASQEIPHFHGILGSANDADKLLPLHLQDLVLAHFINAYIPTEVILKQAKLMLKADGYFSFITTTYESFPQSQAQLAEFVAQDTLLGGLVGHYYKSVVSKTPVASGKEELLELIEKFDLKIISHQRLSVPVNFEDIEEMAKFGIDGTWFLNSLTTPPIPKKFFIERLKRFVNKIFKFPYQDEHIIDILLLKK